MLPESKPSLLPTPAPPESKPYCSPRVAHLLVKMMQDLRLYQSFLDEALIILARKGLIVPPHLLVDLLAWGRNSKQRRVMLTRVVGERGHWLVAHNAQWKNALQFEPADEAELARTIQMMSTQQTLYLLLDITDNIFSQTYSVLKGQGFSANARMIQQVMDSLRVKSSYGQKGTPLPDWQVTTIALAVPPTILPELISHVRKALAEGEYRWLSLFGELLEFRHQMLEELANE